MSKFVCNKKISNLINYFIVIFAFSIPFDKDITKQIIIILLILWFMEGDIKEKFKTIISSPVIVFFILFIAYNYISIFWSNHQGFAFDYVNKYKYYLPIIFIFTSIKKEYIKHSIYAFLIAMVISEIITYGIYFNVWTTPYMEAKVINDFPMAFMSHTMYSVILAFTAIFTLNKIILEKNNVIKFLLILMYLSVSINLFISGGRTGLVPFVVVQFIAIIFLYKFNIKKLLMLMILSIFIFIMAYQNIDIFEKRINSGISDIKNISNQQYSTSFGSRVAMAHTAISIIKENPLFGVGIKDNLDEMITIAYSESRYDIKHLILFYDWHFHNQYIDIITQTGVIGLFLFLGIFFMLYRVKIYDKEINNIKYLFILSVLFSIISSDLFHQKHFMYLITLFIGLILAQNRYEKLEKAKC